MIIDLNKKIFGILRSGLLILAAFHFLTFQIAAQDNKENKSLNNGEESGNVKSPSAVNDKIEFKNAKGASIITITDEGSNAGSITIPQSIPGTTSNKLYNEGGTLKFNGLKVGDGAGEINDLSDAKTDGESLFLGEGSGQNDDAGVSDGLENKNTAVGKNSLFTNINGTNNTAFGDLSLYSNINGLYNSAIGSSSLYHNSSGGSNTADGSFALFSNTTGSYNVGLGYSANYFNQTGSKNTIIGYLAGYGSGLHNKSGNVFLGHKAGYFETGNNKLYIQNDSSSSPLIWGDFALDSLRINGNIHVTGNITSNGSSLGASEINDLNDAIFDGSSLFLGQGSGTNDDGSDNFNTAVGFEALNSNTIGASNTAIGHSALKVSTDGDRNIAIGTAVLFKNQTGDNNTVSGYASLYNNTTGNYNVSMGSLSNFYNETGSRNTIIGYESGRGESLHNKSGNVFLGYRAGYHETGDNKLYINNDSSSAPLIWGDFDSDSLRINGNIHITGNITTDGNAASVASIDDLTDAKFDGSSLFLGLNSGIADDGTNNSNTALGFNSLTYNTSGIDNTSIGFEALRTNTTGQRNSAIGKWALYSNTTGGQNTANGFQALYSNTTGFFNTAIGMSSLLTNTEGFSNTALGRSSLEFNTSGGQNSAVGVSSLHQNTTGSHNTGIGYESNFNNQAGSNNTIIGFQAGKGTNPHSKNGNIFIGYKAGFFETGNNKLYIQNDSSASPLIWGDFTDGDEEVRINGDFHVVGNITSDGSIGAVELDDLSDAISDGSSLFLGVNSGFIDDGLNFNTGVGYNSLYTNTGGTLNTAVGVSSLRSNTTGSYNVGLGNSANYFNQSGSRNTIIGYEAGRGTSLHNKSGNIFIGHKAGYYETSNNKLYIQNDSSSSPLIWGNFADGSEKVKINGDFEITGDLFSTSNRVAIGNNAGVGGTSSFAFGANSISTGGSSFALGSFAQATANSAYAIGNSVQATGMYSVAIGSNAEANGNYSKAIGNNIRVNANGSMFLADNSTTTVHTTVIDNIFNARFANGYKLFTNSSLSVGAQMLAGANSWSVISDSTKKENFKSVNGEEILNKISEFNLSSWNYKGQDPAKFRHYGPMAQDFYNAFGHDGIGTIGNDTTIASADFDGINLIAIQALENRTSQQNLIIEELKEEIKELKRQNVHLVKLTDTLRNKYDVLMTKYASSDIEDRLNKLEMLLSNLNLEKVIFTQNK